MATQGGLMALTDVDISTSGVHSAPIATDRGGGTITVAGGESITSGYDATACSALGGQTYTLAGRGTLQPAE